MEHTDCIGLCVVGAEGIRAYQLSKLLCLVRIRSANRTHFMQNNWNTSLRNLPRGFRAGKAATYNMNGEILVSFDMAPQYRFCMMPSMGESMDELGKRRPERFWFKRYR